MGEALLGVAFIALFVAVVAHVWRQRRISRTLRTSLYPRIEPAKTGTRYQRSPAP